MPRVDGVEVGVNTWESGNEDFPLGPMAVFVGGSFSRDASAGRLVCSAEVSEECMAGLRCASCQGWSWG